MQTKLTYILSICLILSILCACSCDDKKYQTLNDQIDYIDKYELHYDASGPFIVIDANANLLGVYDGREPIEHFTVNCDVDEQHVVTKLDDLSNYGIVLDDEIVKYLQEIGFDGTTPIVIDHYRKVNDGV